MKTIIKMGRWHIFWNKNSSTINGNGYVSWGLVFSKKIGNGDDGTRMTSS